MAQQPLNCLFGFNYYNIWMPDPYFVVTGLLPVGISSHNSARNTLKQAPDPLIKVY